MSWFNPKPRGSKAQGSIKTKVRYYKAPAPVFVREEDPKEEPPGPVPEVALRALLGYDSHPLDLECHCVRHKEASARGLKYRVFYYCGVALGAGMMPLCIVGAEVTQ